ncbi:MAG: hypothetical protein K2N87_07890 [Eubacterium sp.]|nr:hypothetical protein [Eubacterium sp.]
MLIFTSICANYTHKARTLAQSVKKQMPDAVFVVCLTERTIPENVYAGYFDDVVLAKDMWQGNFNRYIFKHSIVEASTAVKGQFFLYLMENYPAESQFVYLDPDCYVYSDFTELKELLTHRPIILCPHLLQPGNIDMELSSTAHGVYNLGFLAVNRSDEAQRFIQWWAQRLYLFCYDDIQRGIFTDQKWIDLAPCFFDVEILKHHGYDFATWSLLDCGMTKEDGKYFIKGDPLRFIHFSGYRDVIEKCMRNWLPDEGHPFRELYQDYVRRHEENDADKVSKAAWSYAAYDSGEKIENALRVKYREDHEVMFGVEDPFALSNVQIRKMLNRKKKGAGNCRKVMRVLKRDGLKVTWSKIIEHFR